MKLKHYIFTFLALFVSTNVFAYNAEIDGIYYNFSENEATVTYRTTGYNSYSGAVIIPTSVTYNNKTYSVTSIGNRAFQNCSSLTSITIPATLKKVGTDAFEGCTSLGKVIVKDIAAWCGIIYDGGSAFSNVNIPLFYALHLYSDENTEITEVVIPEGVTRIEARAFRDAKFITSITIPNSVTYIGREAFRGMHRLTTINIPQTITSIEPYTFQDCETLASVSIPEGVTYIGEYAFAKCYELTNVYCYAEGVLNTESNAFSNTNIGAATLHVPAGSVSQYRTTWPWSDFGTIETLATGISLNQASLSFNAPNQTAALIATITPSYLTNKKVTWTSSNTSVATVSDVGIVTAIANGTATITATITDGTNLSASCEVTVSIHVPAIGVILNQSSLQFDCIGETAYLEAIVLPEDAANKKVRWTSSNESVCVVSNGMVVAVGMGTSVVIATTEDGGFMAVCVVTVTSATGISSVEQNDGMMFQIYDINGMKRKQPQKGINIIRYSDGTSNKLLVK